MAMGWKKYTLGVILLTAGCSLVGQSPVENPLEFLDELSDDVIDQIADYTDILDLLEYTKRHPMDLNTVKNHDLAKFRILNPTEINAILTYRDKYGPFIDPHELQVIPELSLEKIRLLRPYITVHHQNEITQNGAGYVLFRTSGYLPKRTGFRSQDDKPPAYQGSPQSILIKYRHFQRHNYSWGMSLEKDAGESFNFKGKPGFDHIHFHFFRTGLFNKIKTLALGDYRISLGQGLLQYQGFAITKSSNPLMIKRVAPVIQPYSGTSEYNYFRGAAAEFDSGGSIKNFVFIHRKKRDATLRGQPAEHATYFSAFQTNGLHRTIHEDAKRNQVAETIAGHRFQWDHKSWKIGLNSIYQGFSFPYKPVTRIDNIRRLTGSHFIGHSLDFSGHLKSFHLFGEVATQKYRSPAFTVSGLYSFNARLDAALLIRRFPAHFAPIFGNAFSARSTPNNESGIYLGMNYHPKEYSRLSFYLDSWKGLWPTFQAHGPTFDQDFMVRYETARRRKWEMFAQLKWKHRAKNHGHLSPAYNTVTYKDQINFRIQFRKIKYQRWRWTNRIEVVRTQPTNNIPEYGYMVFSDLLFSRLGSWWTYAGRIGWFDIPSYDTRIYSYEPDIRYSFSIPAFYGTGWRIAARISRKWRRGLRIELRTGWTFLPGQDQVGSGYNAVPGSFNQQIKAQMIHEF